MSQRLQMNRARVIRFEKLYAALRAARTRADACTRVSSTRVHDLVMISHRVVPRRWMDPVRVRRWTGNLVVGGTMFMAAMLGTFLGQNGFPWM